MRLRHFLLFSLLPPPGALGSLWTGLWGASASSSLGRVSGRRSSQSRSSVRLARLSVLGALAEPPRRRSSRGRGQGGRLHGCGDPLSAQPVSLGLASGPPAATPGLGHQPSPPEGLSGPAEKRGGVRPGPGQEWRPELPLKSLRFSCPCCLTGATAFASLRLSFSIC